MDYRNEEFGFELKLPDGWYQGPLMAAFKSTGGVAAFLPPKNTARGSLNISVSGRNVIEDRERRERAARKFMRFGAILGLQWGARVNTTGKLLGGEPNTAWVERKQAGQRGSVEVVDGLIEAVRNQRAYALQYRHYPESKREVHTALDSFKFLK